jgi:hypothetical protein
MTLHDLLDDLARTEPVAAPALAERAWTAGRRRRLRVRLQAGIGVAAALALLALVVPPVTQGVPAAPFARGSGAAVDGYPERIGRQWWVRDLPDRPGPVAAILEGDGAPYVVRGDGHRWRLPAIQVGAQVAALSDDGRLLGSLQGFRGPYVVHDLVSGRRTRFPEVKGHLGTVERSRFQVHAQTPARFSPDGRYLLLLGVYDEHLLLDVQAGTVRGLDRRAAGEGAVPVGWLDGGRLAWLVDRQFARPPADVVELVTTDLRGRVLARRPLTPGHGPLPPVSQWTGAVSSDGQSLAVRDDADAQVEVRRFSVSSGRETAPPVPAQAESGCALTWAGDAADPVVAAVPPAPVQGEPSFQAVEVLASTTRPLTAVAPQLQGRCLIWAADALSGPSRGGGLLGPVTDPWTWWWKELLLGGLALVAAAASLVRRFRDRPAPAPRGASVAADDWYA